jgi:hypothetical protein
MKTSELTGCALDWAVAHCEGIVWEQGDLDAGEYGPGFAPATSWAQGGPIIEQEGISTWVFDDVTWKAQTPFVGVDCVYEGPTLLIAAMRCYVASKLGDDVEIPKELT